MRDANKIKNGGLVFKTVFCLLLSVYTLLLLSLFFYAFVNSLKNSWEFMLDPIGFPKVWRWDNYSVLIKRLSMQADPLSPIYYIEHMFAGSLLYAFLGALAMTVATVMVAYACSQFKCALSSIIYFIVIFIISVPIVGALPSEMKMIKQLRFYNNVWSVFILKYSFGSVYFLLLFEALRQVPKDYREAAEIDGASMFTVMGNIVLPMVKSIIGSIFLVQFIAFWNDYSTPMLYFPNVPNFSVGLIDFAFNTSGEIAEETFKLGACFIGTLPILILFCVFQKRLMEGVSAGGIKG